MPALNGHARRHGGGSSPPVCRPPCSLASTKDKDTAVRSVGRSPRRTREGHGPACSGPKNQEEEPGAETLGRALCTSAVRRLEAGSPVSRHVTEVAVHQLGNQRQLRTCPLFPANRSIPHLNGLRA